MFTPGMQAVLIVKGPDQLIRLSVQVVSVSEHSRRCEVMLPTGALAEPTEKEKRKVPTRTMTVDSDDLRQGPFYPEPTVSVMAASAPVAPAPA